MKNLDAEGQNNSEDSVRIINEKKRAQKLWAPASKGKIIRELTFSRMMAFLGGNS
jgi:hypothetical protein